MKRTMVAFVALCAVVGLAGCSSEEDEPKIDYYGTLRSSGMEDATDAELDDFATSTCGYLETLIESGSTPAEAVEEVHRSTVEWGMAETDALVVVTATIGANCPTDTSE